MKCPERIGGRHLHIYRRFPIGVAQDLTLGEENYIIFKRILGLVFSRGRLQSDFLVYHDDL